MGLDKVTQARLIQTELRMESGNFSVAKGVGAGVFEMKLNFGPGYRIYFAKDGEQLVLLLGGGTKRRQQADIQKAQSLWAEYRQEKARKLNVTHTKS